MGLFDHQKIGVAFLQERQKAILADSMGLGKTRQAVMAAKEYDGEVLIIVPASIKIKWAREIRQVDDGRISILNTKQDGQYLPAKWWIINYDIVHKKYDWLEGKIARGEITTVILDEAQYIKGHNTIRACAVVGGKVTGKVKTITRTFAGLTGNVPRVYCLTGTPIMNRPVELFNMLKAIGHPLGANRTAFTTRYCDVKEMWMILNLQTSKKMFVYKANLKYYMDRSKYRLMMKIVKADGAINLDDLRKQRAPYMLRRLKKDVLDLPPKIIGIVDCELDSEWQRTYDSAWDRYLQFLVEHPDPEKDIKNIMDARELVEIQKLKQVCSQAKIERIVADVLEAVDQEQKVVIFSQYTATIEGIARRLRESKIGTVTLTGADTMNARQKSIDSFQNDKDTKVFVANIIAGGVGIDLFAASMVVFADMDWSPETHRQAEDRAHRIGQTGTVNVYYYVIDGTIETDIMELLAEKRKIIDQVLDGKKDTVRTGSVTSEFMKRMRGNLPTG